MVDLRAWVTGTAAVIVFLSGQADARAQLFRGPAATPRIPPKPVGKLPITTDDLPADIREAVRKVLAAPTMTASGPVDEFETRPRTYDWLMMHPDRASVAWQRLNIPCATVREIEPGHFSYSDETGTNVRWKLIWLGQQGRVWFAEGHVKPNTMLPLVPVKAVAVLRHDLPSEPDEVGKIRQQVDLFMYTDSRAAAMVAKMIGPTAPKMAEQGAQQVGMFFSVLARYLDRHPDQVERLLAVPGK